jgi:hypothetical protein
MFAVFLLAFLLLLGPLAYLFGKDTRADDARRGWPSERRR